MLNWGFYNIHSFSPSPWNNTFVHDVNPAELRGNTAGGSVCRQIWMFPGNFLVQRLSVGFSGFGVDVCALCPFTWSAMNSQNRSTIISWLVYSLPICSTCISTVSFTENVALRGKATQSERYMHTFGAAYNAIDGNRESDFKAGSCTHSAEMTDPWWRVDLLESYIITSIIITNRGDCCEHRINSLQINIGNSLQNEGLQNPVWVNMRIKIQNFRLICLFIIHTSSPIFIV